MGRNSTTIDIQGKAGEVISPMRWAEIKIIIYLFYYSSSH